jgi:uncharacterized membrane protein
LSGTDDTDEDPSAERLLFFTDAVVAIAITLLVLPLVELVPEVAAQHAAASEVITGHRNEIGSFLLSFAVIARFWSVHHRLFGGVERYRPSLVRWNLAWLLTIVLLPFPTEMIGAFGNDRFVGSFYVATILAGNICQTAMVFILRRHPELMSDPGRDLEWIFLASAATACVLFFALGLGLLVPRLQYYSLLLIYLVPVLARIRRAREARAKPPAV